MVRCVFYLDRGLRMKVWFIYRSDTEQVDLSVMRWKFKKFPVWISAEFLFLLQSSAFPPGEWRDHALKSTTTNAASHIFCA